MPDSTRDGRSIHFEATGSGPCVVLVPGLGSGAALFGTLPRRFAREGYRCLTFDPVGVAPSSPHAGDYDLDAAARDVLAVADAAGADAFDLVGTSLGGKVGACVAAAAPDRVRRLVLLASALVPSPRGHRIYRFFEILAQRLEPGELAEVLAAFLFGRSFHRHRPKVVEDIVRSMRFDPPTRDLMIAQARCLAGFDGRTLAAAIRCPVLCVAGAEDTLTGADEVAATAELLAAGRYLEIAAAGHSLLLEAAEVLAATLGFLRE